MTQVEIDLEYYRGIRMVGIKMSDGPPEPITIELAQMLGLIEEGTDPWKENNGT